MFPQGWKWKCAEGVVLIHLYNVSHNSNILMPLELGDNFHPIEIFFIVFQFVNTINM